MRGRVPADGSTAPAARHDHWGVVLDAPSAAELAAFYASLLGWRLVSSSPEWATLAPPDGVAYLASQTSAGYQPPLWPSAPATSR